MSIRTHSYLALILVILITLTSCNLSVYNLQALGENDPNLLNISYSIANFGFAPYSQTYLDLEKLSLLN